MASTYTPIANSVVSGSSTSVITFSSIPQTYTDLILVEQATGTAAAYSTMYFNADNAGTSYSQTYLAGTGTTVVSGRVSNAATLSIDYISSGTTSNAHIYQFQSYSNTSVFKTFIQRYNLTNDVATVRIALWRSTAAITTITLTRASGTYTAGSVYSLYGIKAA